MKGWLCTHLKSRTLTSLVKSWYACQYWLHWGQMKSLYTNSQAQQREIPGSIRHRIFTVPQQQLFSTRGFCNCQWIGKFRVANKLLFSVQACVKKNREAYQFLEMSYLPHKTGLETGCLSSCFKTLEKFQNYHRPVLGLEGFNPHKQIHQRGTKKGQQGVGAHHAAHGTPFHCTTGLWHNSSFKFPFKPKWQDAASYTWEIL